MVRFFSRAATVGETSGEPATRWRLLVELFNAYASSSGNDAIRTALVEALVFALSRAFGHHGDYATAEALVDRALSMRPASIHLKSAKHALYLKLNGKEVPERLRKFIGEDNGYLNLNTPIAITSSSDRMKRPQVRRITVSARLAPVLLDRAQTAVASMEVSPAAE